MYMYTCKYKSASDQKIVVNQNDHGLDTPPNRIIKCRYLSFSVHDLVFTQLLG